MTGRPSSWATSHASSADFTVRPSGTEMPTARRMELVRGFSWQMSTAIADVSEVCEAMMRFWYTP
jgi:hypothetical protein